MPSTSIGWTPASQPPALQQPESEWQTPESVPVLVVSKLQRKFVAVYSKDEDAVGKWRTDCSEGWDVTDCVVAWVQLPEWSE